MEVGVAVMTSSHAVAGRPSRPQSVCEDRQPHQVKETTETRF